MLRPGRAPSSVTYKKISLSCIVCPEAQHFGTDHSETGISSSPVLDTHPYVQLMNFEHDFALVLLLKHIYRRLQPL